MQKNEFTVQKNILLQDSKILIVAEEVIKDYILGDEIIILVDASKTKNSRNVYCYDFNGKLIWQIAASDQLHFDNYYTSIYLSEQNLLLLYNINGIEATINKWDGSILKKELIK